jgi:thioesterase domain-containing protein
VPRRRVLADVADSAQRLLLPEDVQWARQLRATSRAARGELDIVLPLRVGDGSPPLFCAPPVAGLSWGYSALLPHILAEHPLYGLQTSRGLQRPEPLPASMAELAAGLADQLRMVQPSGPYHLLGWSLGGIIALALAEELQRRGERIRLLVILDAMPAIPDGMPLAPHGPSPDTDDRWFLYNFVLTEFGYRPTLTAQDTEPEARTLELVRRRPGLVLDDWPDQRVLALLRVIRNNVALARTYRPGRVDCPLLFCAARNPPQLADKLARWRSVVTDAIDVVEVDCLHNHMMLPEPVARIGAAITTLLADEACERLMLAQ